MTDTDALLEDVAAASARCAAGTANMGEYDALSDAAPVLAAEVERLRAELLEARAAAHRWVHGADERETVALRRALDAEEMCAELRLTLAAEQGKPEGAPAGWVYDVGSWRRDWPPTPTKEGTIEQAHVTGDPVDGYVLSGLDDFGCLVRMPGFETQDRWHYRTARAAMLAADEVKP